MGLLVLTLVAAAVLLLLIVVTVVIVKIILFVSVKYTLLALALSGLYWAIESRRQQYAKGFYSCSRVPQQRQPQQSQSTPKLPEHPVQEIKRTTGHVVASEPLSYNKEKELPEEMDVYPPTKNTQETSLSATEDEDEEDEEVERANTMILERHSSSELTTAFHDDESDDAKSETSTVRKPRSLRRRASSLTHELKRKAMPTPSPYAERFRRDPSRSNSVSGTSSNNSGNEPVSRMRRATTVGNGLKHRRDLYQAANQVSERQLIEDALEADGYWIGDFRVQRQVVRRNHNSPTAV